MVLGMPRSGTTLTEQIISSHPAVAGGGELPFWLEAGPPWARGATGGPTSENTRHIAADYLTVLRDIAPDAMRVTDKMPANFLWIGLIHLISQRHGSFIASAIRSISACRSTRRISLCA